MDNFWQKLKKPILALAPMAGVCDLAFRQMCKMGGADVLYNEFVSAEALIRDNEKTKKMLRFAESEHPIVCQLFGSSPQSLARASVVAGEMGFDGVDINFGCPAYKVVKNGGGVSLMREPARCAEIISAVCAVSPIPISIKLRASVGQDITALDVLEVIKNLPVSAVMLHGRSYEQAFDGEPQWEIVAGARKIFGEILLANGGIDSGEKARQVLVVTGADGIGIARGAWGRPGIFDEIKKYLAGEVVEAKSREEIIKQMLRHGELALAHGGEYGLIELRKHLGWYVRGWPDAREIRSRLVQITSLTELREILLAN